MLVLLYGGFAVGKTHALDEFVNSWLSTIAHGTLLPIPQVKCIHADNGRMKYWDGGELVEEKLKGWQGKIEVKSQLMYDCMDDDSTIYIVESGRPDGEKYVGQHSLEIGGGVEVVYALCTWRIMKEFLMARCEKKGKAFNKEFWDFKNLQYNANYRPMNQAARFLVPNNVPHRIFSIDSERLAWKNVLAHLWDVIHKPIKEWYNEV